MGNTNQTGTGTAATKGGVQNGNTTTTNPTANIQSQQPANGIDFNESDLQYVESRDADEAYGEIRVLKLIKQLQQQQQQPNDQQDIDQPLDVEIGIKSKIFDTKEDCEEYYKIHAVNEVLVHPHIVGVVKGSKVTNSNLCTNVYRVDLAYEYHRHSLAKEIFNRFTTQQFFEEASIFDMIEQVMSGLFYLKQNSIYHGDISPSTILIDNSDLFKITDIQFMTSGMCGYRKQLAGIDSECFLAPELLSALRRQTILMNDEFDGERSDIFSLGLVALAMSTLKPVDTVYNYDTYTLQEEQILELLDQVKTQYGDNLYLLLVSMLNQVDRRIDLENGLNLIDQMRSGQFSQEEYEMRKFQSELENSERKMNQQQQLQGVPQQQNNNQVVVEQFNENNQNNQQNKDSNTVIPATTTAGAPNNNNPQQPRQQQQQQQASPSKEEINDPKYLAYLAEQEQLEKEAHRQQQQQQQQLELEADSKRIKQSLPANQAQPAPLHDQHNVINPNSAAKQLNDLNNNYAAQNALSNIQNQVDVQDVEARVREALLRSQQVSLKFENSPLRLFRDQLLADELYVPLDPSMAGSQSHLRSRNLESSGRKNIQPAKQQQTQLQQSQQQFQSKMIYQNNHSLAQNSQVLGNNNNSKKSVNTSQSKLVQQKWKR